MTPALGAAAILAERSHLDFVVETLAERARTHAALTPEEAEALRQRVRERALDLLAGVQLRRGRQHARVHRLRGHQ